MSAPRRGRAGLLCAAAALLLACGGAGPDGDADRPGGEPADGAGLVVEIGAGAPGVFAPVAPGATLLLQRGCQGAQHVFTSLRARGAARGPLRVAVVITRSDDRQVVSVPLDLRLPAEPDPTDAAAARVTGLTPVVEVPRDVIGREVIVDGAVTDEAGRRGAAQLRGVVQWGPDSCAAHG